MKLHLHQTHHTIADFSEIFNYLSNLLSPEDSQKTEEGLHLFPELFLTGYPLQDLCLQKNFIVRYHELLEKINELSLSSTLKNCELLIGGLYYELDEQLNIPRTIKNVIYRLSPGKKLENIYTKQLLPNYDIFDERKYYTPETESKIIELLNKNVALMICEDMWPSITYKHDPTKQLHEKKNNGENIDLIINLSASPFNMGKQEKRIQRAKEISHTLEAPFYYVNKVGAEDEIIFDGGSFVVNNHQVQNQALRFKSDIISVELSKYNNRDGSKTFNDKIANTWDDLFEPTLDFSKKIPVIQRWDDERCQEILDAIGFSIQDYASKSGFSKFSVALSGGIDSTLVLTILKMYLHPSQYLEAIYMPGLYSAGISYDLSMELCKNLNVPMSTVPIKFTHKAVRNLFTENFGTPLDGVADENIQSRLRGSYLYTRSNQINSMVLNTSNKSEIAVGYSTQYGDSVGALSVLGDVYKSEVFRLCDYINQKYNDVIPQQIISRPPSAELRENQEDSHSLPPYERLDAMLEGILSYRHSTQDLLDYGFKLDEVEKVMKLYQRSEFKRYQFSPIIKIRQKSFGFGYRNPICKKLF